MKRALALLLFILCFFLASCGENKYGILPFEGKCVYARCEINGKFTVTVEKNHTGCCLKVISPSEISGLEFHFSEEGDYIISDSMKIPADRNSLSGIYAISSLFNIEEDAMTSAVSEDGCGSITFTSSFSEYLLIFDKKGYLTDAEITGDGFSYNVKILSMKIE